MLTARGISIGWEQAERSLISSAKGNVKSCPGEQAQTSAKAERSLEGPSRPWHCVSLRLSQSHSNDVDAATTVLLQMSFYGDIQGTPSMERKHPCTSGQDLIQELAERNGTEQKAWQPGYCCCNSCLEWISACPGSTCTWHLWRGDEHHILVWLKRVKRGNSGLA